MQPPIAPDVLVTQSIELPNNLVLQYVEQGDHSGLPVVFLHGATDSLRSFEGVFPHLPSSMRAISLSLRGHGDSSRPETGYRFVDFSTDVRHFLDALEIRAAVIVGHSMGSYVAQRFALDHPGRTLGLVLMGSFPRLLGNVGVLELWDSVVSTLTDPVDPAIALEFQKSTLARPIEPDALQTFVSESLKVPARVWREIFGEFLGADFSNELRSIASPTLIVWGDQDVFFSRSEQDELHDAISGSRLLVYPGAGHAFHWEDPARFASDLVTFTQRL